MATKNPLLCVVTGMERSGTTLLSQLLNGHPDVASGVELGFLLSEISNYSTILPFYDWLTSENWGWAVLESDRDILLSAPSFDKMYERLNAVKGRGHKNEYLRDLFSQSKYLYDKTPRYIYSLNAIVRKVDRPFVVTLKSPLEGLDSARKRKIDAVTFLKSYVHCLLQTEKALHSAPHRVLIVKYRSLAERHIDVMNRVKNFIELDDDTVLDIDTYDARFGNYIESRNSFDKRAVKYRPPSKNLSSFEKWLLRDFDSRWGPLLEDIYSKAV